MRDLMLEGEAKMKKSANRILIYQKSDYEKAFLKWHKLMEQ
jgi:hypothetical protein